MKLKITEQSRGISVCLTVELDAQALGLPGATAQFAAIAEPDQTQFSDQCLDSVHAELLQLLRQARYAAERSLAVCAAEQIHVSLDR
ncbi:hypothetical protein [Limnohabitans lacus]|uniref:DUF1488 domain-containing protein n=1 Tax=Limnohabitans lacus TaxID=3045173 RepID=A0ABT6X885_9BURK|nr:hypothetical protein [Limnohabitans sp. HM2-2]MDI9234340.1 hypothetical protein [Limnohabitans sp. HM2-2]